MTKDEMPTAGGRPRLQAPGAWTVIASVCAVLCLGAVVWTVYAGMGLRAFDVQQAVLRPVAAWLAPGPAAPMPARRAVRRVGDRIIAGAPGTGHAGP